MSRSTLSTLAILGVIVLLIIATSRTVQESGAPVDLRVSVTVDYRGSQIGSLVLEYHWVSGELEQSSSLETVSWLDSTVSASSSADNDIEEIIIDYLGEASASGSWLTIGKDSSWTATFPIIIGGSLPVTLSFTGKGSDVTDIAVSGEASMLPSGLRIALRQLGVTDLDLKVNWSLTISKDFLTDWVANVLEVAFEGWNSVVDIGSESLGAINLSS